MWRSGWPRGSQPLWGHRVGADIYPVVRLEWLGDADPALGLPRYETAGAAGADLRANLAPGDRASGLVLAPMGRMIVPTGLRIELPDGYEAQIRPRSGLAANYGVTLANSPGTIDADYRGPLGVIMINLGPDPFTIAHGDRIAQIVVAPVVQARFALAEGLGATARGAAGFGSTGRR